MYISDIEKLYQDGFTKIRVTKLNGDKEIYRLFKGQTYGQLCYFAKGKSRCGYQFTESLVSTFASADGIKSVQIKNALERELDGLRKFKKAFTQNAHPNLWSNLVKDYAEFDVNDFERYANENLTEEQKNDSGDVYSCLSKYSQEHNSHIILENCWKTTTIKSNAPTNSYNYRYNDCIASIKNHLDNKENFYYNWNGKYDVSVEGKLGNDDVYRAWLSLEYRGCGNGHYYLLINENQALFTEDD